MESLIAAVPVAARIAAYGLLMSPFPTAWSMWRRQSVTPFPFAPFLSILTNGLATVLYAAATMNADLLTVGMFGSTCGILLCAVYVRFSPTARRHGMYTLAVCATTAVGYTIVTRTTVAPPVAEEVAFQLGSGEASDAMAVAAAPVAVPWVRTVCGLLFNSCGIFMYLAPLGKIRDVIRTKRVLGIPFYLSAFSFVNAVLWFLYGVVIRDTFMQALNVVGVAATALQLALFLLYPFSVAAPAKVDKAHAASTRV